MLVRGCEPPAFMRRRPCVINMGRGAAHGRAPPNEGALGRMTPRMRRRRECAGSWRAAARQGRSLLLIAAMLPLGACSSFPESMNPLSWFDSDGKQSQASAARPARVATQPLDATQPVPSLSSVPEPPKPTMDPGQRLAMRRDLESDRQTARQQDTAVRQATPAPATPTPAGSGEGARLVRPVPPAGGVAPAAPSSPIIDMRTAAPGAETPVTTPVPMPEALPPPAARRTPEPPPASAALPAPTYSAEPPPARTAAAPAAPAAPPARGPATGSVATQPGARYAITPRPPISPPEPLSAQPGGFRSSSLPGAKLVQLAAAGAENRPVEIYLGY